MHEDEGVAVLPTPPYWESTPERSMLRLQETLHRSGQWLVHSASAKGKQLAPGERP